MSNDRKMAVLTARIASLQEHCAEVVERVQVLHQNEEWDLLYHRANELKMIANALRRDTNALADLDV